MSLWIKICGNTSFEDALLAAEAGRMLSDSFLRPAQGM